MTYIDNLREQRAITTRYREGYDGNRRTDMERLVQLAEVSSSMAAETAHEALMVAIQKLELEQKRGLVEERLRDAIDRVIEAQAWYHLALSKELTP